MPATSLHKPFRVVDVSNVHIHGETQPRHLGADGQEPVFSVELDIVAVRCLSDRGIQIEYALAKFLKQITFSVKEVVVVLYRRSWR